MKIPKILEPVADSLRGFRGNARTCILVEPLWGISYNLFVPYASLYMLSLGVSEGGIGAIASLGMVLQMFWSFSGGWITDRLGRRRTSPLFDLISWSAPTLIWAFARDLKWFLAAAVLNSAVRVVHISWSCLFIEDSEPGRRVSLYTWMSVAGTVSGFFAPAAGLLVKIYGLVPATRGLYVFAFLAMTSMFLVRNAFTKETTIGKLKMEESKGSNARAAFAEYREAARLLLSRRESLIAFLLAVLSNIHLQTRNSFLSVVLTKGVGLSPALIAVFPPLAAATTLAVYLLVIPRVKRVGFALFLSLGANVVGNLAIFFAPAADSAGAGAATLAAVLFGTFAVAVGTGVAGPVVDAVLANSVDESKRATIMSIIYTLMFAISAPFGWLTGVLAEAGGRLPALFAAAAMLAAVALALSVREDRRPKA